MFKNMIVNVVSIFVSICCYYVNVIGYCFDKFYFKRKINKNNLEFINMY